MAGRKKLPHPKVANYFNISIKYKNTINFINKKKKTITESKE
jgi:hypothetical protein